MSGNQGISRLTSYYRYVSGGFRLSIGDRLFVNSIQVDTKVLHIHSGIRFGLIRNIIRSNLRTYFRERY